MSWVGVDVGGSGIKGALVDLEAGELIGDRYRIPTPQPSSPKAVSATIADIVDHFQHRGPVGVTLPSVVIGGVVHTAANIDDSWIGVDARALFSDVLGTDVVVLNDADAAGIAEMTYGAGRDHEGTVWLITLGTGIGSALFTRGALVPNTELGHLRMGDVPAELLASSRAREEADLPWKEWAQRLTSYLRYAESLFWPDLVIVGGGISKQWSEFGPLLDIRADIVPAELRNHAGIVGAAAVAHDEFGEDR